MEKNMFALQDLDSLEYFGDVQENNEDDKDYKPPADGNRFRDRKRDEKDEIKSHGDLRNHLLKELKANATEE